MTGTALRRRLYRRHAFLISLALPIAVAGVAQVEAAAPFVAEEIESDSGDGVDDTIEGVLVPIAEQRPGRDTFPGDPSPAVYHHPSGSSAGPRSPPSG